MMIALYIFLIAFVGDAFSLACAAQYRCSYVSADYNYVGCVSGQCVCYNNLGFTGNATTGNKCRCEAPDNVYWAGSPYCISFSTAAADKISRQQIAYQETVITQIYNSLIWPIPQAIIYALVTGGYSPYEAYFAVNATGRVDPVGTFVGQDGIVEYFYGAVWTGATRVSKVDITSIGSKGNKVFVSVNIFFDIMTADQTAVSYSYNLTQSGSFSFNGNGLIFTLDLIIHNLGAASDSTGVIDPTAPAFLGQICYVLLNIAGCNQVNDPTGYYTDMNDCLASFSSWRPGTLDNIYFNGNSTMCRYFHMVLALARPSVHCAHSGKTGGGKCIDHPYSSYYASSYQNKKKRSTLSIADVVVVGKDTFTDLKENNYARLHSIIHNSQKRSLGAVGPVNVKAMGKRDTENYVLDLSKNYNWETIRNSVGANIIGTVSTEPHH